MVVPNIRLTGVAIGPLLEARFKTPIALGNDVNLGPGRTWLGSAGKARSALDICVGTGIGSGIVIAAGCTATASRPVRSGTSDPAGGPKCGCGNHGCFEALASRTAIESDIATPSPPDARPCSESWSAATSASSAAERPPQGAQGRGPAGDRGHPPRGRSDRRRLPHLRHLLDPEVIVLGGGVLEACRDFIMPIIQNAGGPIPFPAPGPAGGSCSRRWATTRWRWGPSPPRGNLSAEAPSRRALLRQAPLSHHPPGGR